jgi:hypothetical protein
MKVIAINKNIWYPILKGGYYMVSNRGLKNRTAISTSIDKELYAKLKAYSEETGIPLSKLFDKAITAYLEAIKRE